MPTYFPSAFRAHPWHGVELGAAAPAVVTAYIEIVPTDTVKYEIDKGSGLLKVDRPQRFSNVCPSLYGFTRSRSRTSTGVTRLTKLFAAARPTTLLPSWEQGC